jgi:NifU-like protein involved in Fe-S cluster formation
MYRQILKFISGNFDFNAKNLVKEYINNHNTLTDNDKTRLKTELKEYNTIYPKDNLYAMLKTFKPLALHMAKLKLTTAAYKTYEKNINDYFDSIEENRGS